MILTKIKFYLAVLLKMFPPLFVVSMLVMAYLIDLAFSSIYSSTDSDVLRKLAIAGWALAILPLFFAIAVMVEYIWQVMGLLRLFGFKEPPLKRWLLTRVLRC